MLLSNLAVLILAGMAFASPVEPTGTTEDSGIIQGHRDKPRALKQLTTEQLIRRARRSPTIGRRAAPSPAPPPATVIATTNVKSTYTNYYTGSGIIENDTNNGNPGNTSAKPPRQILISGGTTQNTAIQQCVDFANSGDPVNGGYGSAYYSLQIYYDTAADNWVCRTYYNGNKATSAFNVVNPNANPAFGYSL
ncbi:hypothetical protein IAT40_005647 [Kwoniella sp. CBS 6097]